MEDVAARNNRILRLAAVFASLAAVLIVWSFLDPHNHAPVARLVGQMFGTFAFVAFNYVAASTSSSAGAGTCLAGPAGVSSAGTSPGPDGPP
jgi:hypothetical protein